MHSIRKLLTGGLVTAVALGSLSAHAAVVVFNPFMDNDDASANVNVIITLEDDGSGGVTGVAEVAPTLLLPNIGDIRGLFFDFASGSVVCADVTGADVTDCGLNVANLGGGANINPLGPFDLGIEIGSSGIGGGDDIQSTSFAISGISTSDFAQASVRLTSVGVGDLRDNSSKLKPVEGDRPPNEVPAPGVLGLLAVGLLGLAARARRS
jgi:hypothetical protein